MIGRARQRPGVLRINQISGGQLSPQQPATFAGGLRKIAAGLVDRECLELAALTLEQINLGQAHPRLPKVRLEKPIDHHTANEDDGNRNSHRDQFALFQTVHCATIDSLAGESVIAGPISSVLNAWQFARFRGGDVLRGRNAELPGSRRKENRKESHGRSVEAGLTTAQLQLTLTTVICLLKNPVQ